VVRDGLQGKRRIFRSQETRYWWQEETKEEEMVNSIMTNVDHSQEGETRFHIVMPDDENVRELVVIVTHEAIIMDVYDRVETDEDDTVLDDVHSGTVCMGFDEWADWAVKRDDDLWANEMEKRRLEIGERA
tara:strand:+ start:1454 stop:1846 length:393 start_codon:yes stop_codon:yes gene_type:complete